LAHKIIEQMEAGMLSSSTAAAVSAAAASASTAAAAAAAAGAGAAAASKKADTAGVPDVYMYGNKVCTSAICSSQLLLMLSYGKYYMLALT
jgi:hypothetical protein